MWSWSFFFDGGTDVFGQRLSALGAELGGAAGDDFRISDAGGTGSDDFLAGLPALAWNAADNEYLVVWSGTDDVGELHPDEHEIFAQRLDSEGGEIGTNDFRITDLGGVGNQFFGGGLPDVVWNPISGEYLVVWSGDDSLGGLVLHENEIFGQRLAADGAEIGANDFRISDAGGIGSSDFFASSPSVVWNGTSHEYLVVWFGDDDVGDLVFSELEVFGQRLVRPIFTDGFESGDVAAWSAAFP